MWRKNVSNLLDVFKANRDNILKVISKIFPFSTKELIEEVKAQKVLNHLPDYIKDRLDPEREKVDANIILEDFGDSECNKKSNETKYKRLQQKFYRIETV